MNLLFPVAVGACSSITCPSPTYCYTYSNSTAQCLCPSDYTVLGWTNSFTQACVSSGQSVVTIVLPVVFGLLGIQLVIFGVCVIRRKRLNAANKKETVYSVFDDQRSVGDMDVNKTDGIAPVNLPRPRFEYYRNPALNWKELGTRGPNQAAAK